MAKHAKRRKQSHSRRRRRVGAMAMSATSPIVKFGSIAAGFLLGGKINEAIDKVVPTNVDSKLVGAGQAGLGYFLALRRGGKKSLVTTVAGGLMLGSGAKRLLTAFGIGSIGGYQMVPAISGYGDVPTVGAGRRRVGMGSYMPGAHGLNGYATTRNAVGSLGGADLLGSDLHN